MEEKDETFRYTYSAAEQKEVEQIRAKYAPPAREEDRLAQLRRLDKSAARPGTAAAIAAGVLGLLAFGAGMSCVLVWGDTLFWVGVAVGAAGMAAMGAAYPLYVRITQKRRAQLAPEILRLTEELLQ